MSHVRELQDTTLRQEGSDGSDPVNLPGILDDGAKVLPKPFHPLGGWFTAYGRCVNPGSSTALAFITRPPRQWLRVPLERREFADTSREVAAVTGLGIASSVGTGFRPAIPGRCG